VERVDQDHLVVLILVVLDPISPPQTHQDNGNLVDPVRVKDSEATQSLSHSLLGHRLQVLLHLLLVDTLVDRLAVNIPLNNSLHRPGRTPTDRSHSVHFLLPISSSNSHSVYNESLLGSVSQSTRLLRSSRLRDTLHGPPLPVLPAPNAQQEAHHVALLLPPELLDIFRRSHSLWRQTTLISLK